MTINNSPDDDAENKAKDNPIVKENNSEGDSQVGMSFIINPDQIEAFLINNQPRSPEARELKRKIAEQLSGMMTLNRLICDSLKNEDPT